MNNSMFTLVKNITKLFLKPLKTGFIWTYFICNMFYLGHIGEKKKEEDEKIEIEENESVS